MPTMDRGRGSHARRKTTPVQPIRADDPNRPKPPAGFVEVTMGDGSVAVVPHWRAAEMRREGDAVEGEGGR